MQDANYDYVIYHGMIHLGIIDTRVVSRRFTPLVSMLDSYIDNS